MGPIETPIRVSLRAIHAFRAFRPVAAMWRAIAEPRGMGLVGRAMVLALIVDHRLHVDAAGLVGARMTGEARLLVGHPVVTVAAVVRCAVVAVRKLAAGGAGIMPAVAVHPFLGLLTLLLAIGENDAIVVFSVLEIILCENVIAGGVGIASELEILFGDVCRRTADLHIGAVGFEAPRQRVLALPVALMVVVVHTVVIVAAAATTMLLSLPHGLPISDFLLCRSSSAPGAMPEARRSLRTDFVVDVP
jgi:hypothetical protein